MLAAWASALALCSSYDAVVEVGFGKSGTSSTADFFKRLGYGHCNGRLLMSTAVSQGRPILFHVLRNCTPPFFIGELAGIYFDNENVQFQLTHLHFIYVGFKHAMGRRVLYVQTHRNALEWYNSVNSWNNLKARFTVRDIDGLPAGVGASPTDLIAWYVGANRYLSWFFHHEPNHVAVVHANNFSLRQLFTKCNSSLAMRHLNHNRRAKAPTGRHPPPVRQVVKPTTHLP